jgi:DNA-binding PadR family transcriptional regulator
MRFRHDYHHHVGHGHEHGHDSLRGRGPFGRGGGRGPRGARFFEQGDLRLVILQMLAQQPRYGYELIKEIEDRLGGAYSPSPGVVYPTLTLLEELGYATVRQADGPKKLYTITPEGEAYLEQNRATVDALFARIEQAGGGRRDFAPRIMRAMGNVKMALRLKIAQGSLTSEQVDKIAAALDAAALDIERS